MNAPCILKSVTSSWGDAQNGPTTANRKSPTMNQEIESKFRSLGGIVPIGDVVIRVDEEELSSLETSLGAPLPRDYRLFLSEYGASIFGECVEFQPVHRLPMTISSTGRGPFGCFYGAKSERHQSLSKKIGTFQGRMPDNLIPIGHDGGGNQICLGISGNEQDKVYYWDHNHEWDEEDYLEDYGKPMPPEVKFQNVYLIAESFEDFIQRLEKFLGDPSAAQIGI